MTYRSLLDRCLAHTGREYPAGYGFALAFLDDGFTPSRLLKEANRQAARALMGLGPLDRHDGDVLGFVAAQGNAKRPEDWMVEGAQLVLAAGILGDVGAAQVLGACGHPGYT